MPDRAATPVMLEFQSAQTRLPAFSAVQAVEPKAELECSGTDFLVAERPGNAAVDYERLGAASVQELLPGLKKVSFPSSKASLARARLASDKRIKSVEADCLFALAQDPNDESYLGWQSQLRQMRFNNAWNDSTGFAYVMVSNPDTGVNLAHPDLANIVIPGLAFNSVDGSSNVEDINGHGTTTAGALAAETNNEIGIASGSWASNGKIGLIPIRVTNNPSGNALASNIVTAIRYAADHGAKVVSLSYNFGQTAAADYAGTYLRSKGGLLFVSAGNTGAQVYATNFPNVIVVSAVTPDETLYSWSTYGRFVDFAAPGCTEVTRSTGGYTTACGTSYSAPLAASAAALLFSAFPQATNEQVEQALKDGAFDSYSPGADIYTGYGRVDAKGAMDALLEEFNDTTPPAVSIALPINGERAIRTKFILVKATDASGIAKVELYVNGALLGTATSPGAGGYYSFPWSPLSRSVGPHKLLARAFDIYGNSATDFVIVS